MEVNPEKQNIHTLFSTTNYHIDFYQREYKWKDDTVLQLINKGGIPNQTPSSIMANLSGWDMATIILDFFDIS